MNPNGYLELYLGSMYASKTTRLLSEIKRYRAIDIPVLTINYEGDDRYGSNNICSHDNTQLDAMCVRDLMSLIDTDQYRDAKVIAINEGQFMTNLAQFVSKAVDTDKKTVLICGLDGDFEREPFKNGLLELIPHADHYEKLTGFCSVCKDGTKAIFTRRIVESMEKELIGGADSYIPVCRMHHNQSF